MISIGICDDQEVFIEKFKTELEKYFATYQSKQEYVLSCYNNPKELFDDFSDKNFSIVFMDLVYDSKDQDGILWSKRIHDAYQNVLVIILTSYEERIKEGFYARAYRFMTKPLIWQELKENMDACMEELEEFKLVPVTIQGVDMSIMARNLIVIEARAGGSVLYGTNSNLYCQDGLVVWEKKLSETLFFRCNRKYIINLCHIQKLDQHYVYLTNGQKLPVSRRRWTELQKRFIQYDLGAE